jgi:hypothetical protein
MSIEISRETEARLTDEARKQGLTVESFLQRLMNEHGAIARFADTAPDLPVWQPGGAGPLHRRDIYNDVG